MYTKLGSDKRQNALESRFGAFTEEYVDKHGNQKTRKQKLPSKKESLTYAAFALMNMAAEMGNITTAIDGLANAVREVDNTLIIMKSNQEASIKLDNDDGLTDAELLDLERIRNQFKTEIEFKKELSAGIISQEYYDKVMAEIQGNKQDTHANTDQNTEIPPVEGAPDCDEEQEGLGGDNNDDDDDDDDEDDED